jgi:hypothetical protein
LYATLHDFSEEVAVFCIRVIIFHSASISFLRVYLYYF